MSTEKPVNQSSDASARGKTYFYKSDRNPPYSCLDCESDRPWLNPCLVTAQHPQRSGWSRFTINRFQN